MKRSILLAAALAVVAFVPAGLASEHQAEVTKAKCLQAWHQSQASHHCPASSNQFWVLATKNGLCHITTRCRTYQPLPAHPASGMHDLVVSLDEVASLCSFNGSLEVGHCPPPPPPPTPTTLENCKRAWLQSPARRTCRGEIYQPGSHKISVSKDQCHIRTVCMKGGGFRAPKFKGPPDDVRQLRNCDGQLHLGPC